MSPILTRSSKSIAAVAAIVSVGRTYKKLIPQDYNTNREEIVEVVWRKDESVRLQRRVIDRCVRPAAPYIRRRAIAQPAFHGT